MQQTARGAEGSGAGGRAVSVGGLVVNLAGLLFVHEAHHHYSPAPSPAPSPLGGLKHDRGAFPPPLRQEVTADQQALPHSSNGGRLQALPGAACAHASTGPPAAEAAATACGKRAAPLQRRATRRGAGTGRECGCSGGVRGADLNMRAIFLHIMADTLGSLAVILSTLAGYLPHPGPMPPTPPARSRVEW